MCTTLLCTDTALLCTAQCTTLHCTLHCSRLQTALIRTAQCTTQHCTLHTALLCSGQVDLSDGEEDKADDAMGRKEEANRRKVRYHRWHHQQLLLRFKHTQPKRRASWSPMKATTRLPLLSKKSTFLFPEPYFQAIFVEKTLTCHNF